MANLMRLLGWHRQMNAARALVGIIFAIATKIQATESSEEPNNPSPMTDAELDDVMDMDLEDISAIQAFNSRFNIDR